MRGNLAPREMLCDVLQSIMGKFAVTELEWASMTQCSVHSWHARTHAHTRTSFLASLDPSGSLFVGWSDSPLLR